MPYIDVFMAAVPRARKADYIAHAEQFGQMFKRYGALDYREAWAEDVPDGEVTSMPMAVQKNDDEDVVVGWTIWADKATRDKAWTDCETDPVMKEFGSTMPFDGKRLIYGGFDQIVGD
ncbi:DUF1428 domain-containing protein [Algimonas porphyrae]|uniref:DUF1428 domain-containing protein n=1 Tax=Algimonas porphyrae TaxID=1128113 RepID=A0ABQ5V0Q8_9PROT|nr:DUF1428 domain-containing protein [Algimonas porphyrae]GLQ20249.1 DUF1428 domain-containing protein [Algimonas porphyrae]